MQRGLIVVIYLSFSWLAAFELCHSIKIITIALKPCHYIYIKIIIVVFTSTEMVEMIIVCLSSAVFIKIIIVACLSSTISLRWSLLSAWVLPFSSRWSLLSAWVLPFSSRWSLLSAWVLPFSSRWSLLSAWVLPFYQDDDGCPTIPSRCWRLSLFSLQTMPGRTAPMCWSTATPVSRGRPPSPSPTSSSTPSWPWATPTSSSKASAPSSRPTSTSWASCWSSSRTWTKGTRCASSTPAWWSWSPPSDTCSWRRSSLSSASRSSSSASSPAPHTPGRRPSPSSHTPAALVWVACICISIATGSLQDVSGRSCRCEGMRYTDLTPEAHLYAWVYRKRHLVGPKHVSIGINHL